ncbi:MAG: DUF177 domain-containing protein [Cyanobacteria bacterium M_surface_10_m2_179]|nr:DUF177 domain-containing protein [Cyanobacteria bacterium M_surface_10_m2_179]
MSAAQPAGDPLQPVPLQELRPLADGRHWQVNQLLSELDSLTPVRGELTAVHRGNILEVSGQASTIITLRCDRCLQHFNHPLSFQHHEVVWLGDQARLQGIDADAVLEGGSEVLELDPDALTESIDPSGSFDPEHWVFEQLSLQLPLVNRCGSDCPGPELLGAPAPTEPIDPRWAALKKLQP